jgi:hypothetical protein
MGSCGAETETTTSFEPEVLQIALICNLFRGVKSAKV